MNKNDFRRGSIPSRPNPSDCYVHLTPNQRIPFGKFEQTNHVPLVIHGLNWSNASCRVSVWFAADCIAIVILLFALSPFL